MKMNKKLSARIEDSKKSDGYWVEKAKLDFSLGLEKQRRSNGLTYAAIAKLIGTSAAYITKVFRGDTNVTIETMVKLARASGGQLNIEIVEPVTKVEQWQAQYPAVNRAGVGRPTKTTNVYTFPEAANKNEYDWQLTA